MLGMPNPVIANSGQDNLLLQFCGYNRKLPGPPDLHSTHPQIEDCLAKFTSNHVIHGFW
ncbi:rCG22845, partial [Rattus norvegicus]